MTDLKLIIFNNIYRAYFDKTGIGYSIARIPMGGTDFSLRPYTYADTADDVNLSKFSLQEEDHTLKVIIPQYDSDNDTNDQNDKAICSCT